MDLPLIVVLEDKLQCGNCAEVLVQIDDTSLLSENDGVIDPALLKTFIKARIESFTPVFDKFKCVLFQYNLKYDSDQLSDENNQIGECNVLKICCAQCVFDYVDERFADQAVISSMIDNMDNTFTHDSGNGTVVDVSFQYDLSESVPGVVTLTDPQGGTDDINVTNIVDLPITGLGIPGDPLGILLSVDAGNIAILGTDSGIFVPTPTPETVTTLVDNGDNTFTYTNEVAAATVFDAEHDLTSPTPARIRLTRPDTTFNEVDVTVVVELPILGDGSTGDPLDILISTDAGNDLSLGTDTGLYVDETVDVTLPIQGDGSAGDPIDILISTDAFNAVVLGTDTGLFVSPMAVISTTLPIQGDGSFGDPVDLLISVDAGNQIVLGTDTGVFVPIPTVVTALPIQGDGSAGDALDLLISTDADNQISLGTDTGIFVPELDNGSILITRTPGESHNNGTSAGFDVRVQTLSASGTSESGYAIQIPSNWDTSQDPTVRARVSNANAADGDVRYEWGVRHFAPGEVLDTVDDEAIPFTHVVASAANEFYEPASQTLDRTLIAPGDLMVIEFRRIGSDGADTQSGGISLYQISVEFPRTVGDFGVTT